MNELKPPCYNNTHTNKIKEINQYTLHNYDSAFAFFQIHTDRSLKISILCGVSIFTIEILYNYIVKIPFM